MKGGRLSTVKSGVRRTRLGSCPPQKQVVLDFGGLRRGGWTPSDAADVESWIGSRRPRTPLWTGLLLVSL